MKLSMFMSFLSMTGCFHTHNNVLCVFLKTTSCDSLFNNLPILLQVVSLLTWIEISRCILAFKSFFLYLNPCENPCELSVYSLL